MISDRFPEINPENDMSEHRSDFYVIFTPAVWHWLLRIHPDPNNVSKFTGTDGRKWIEVPFVLPLPKSVYNA